MKILKKFTSTFIGTFALLSIFSLGNLNSNEALSVEDIRQLEEIKLGESIVKEEEKFLEIQTSVLKEETDCVDCIFGFDFFIDTPTTFALSSNTPVPQDYVLGPGDKIKIEYFGNNKNQSETYISRSGFLKLPLLGPVNIAGLDLLKAEELIRKKIEEELIGTEVFISISELRSINVYLVGAAFKPGTYTVSALASLTNVIFSTGGPNKVGSLRNIQVKRNGNLITSFDFYDLLLKGDTSKNIRLQEGDSIFFPLIQNSVEIKGAVKRPGRYEIQANDKLSDILDFVGLRFKDDIKIEFSRYSKSLGLREINIFDNIESPSEILLNDGDSINVLFNSNKISSNVYLSGEINFPGYYAIMPGDKVSEVIERAGGFGPEAYPQAAVFTREAVRLQQKASYLKTADNLEKTLLDQVSSGSSIDGEAYMALNQFIQKLRDQEPLGRQVAQLDTYSLKTDPQLDFVMQDGDTLFIPKRPSSISVVGEVLNPSTLLFNNELSIEDYLAQAGGLTDAADPSKIFIILPSGQSVTYQKKLFREDLSANLLPGSSIVVSRNPDPYNWTKLAGVISPILSDLAVSAAAISAISNSND